MADRLVCMCNMVSELEIKNELKKGARSTTEIQMATRAGTSCGKCLPQIDQIVEDFCATIQPDPQGKLDF